MTANVVKAVTLYAYDLDYRLLGAASRDPAIADSTVVICQDLASRASTREGPKRLTPVTEICLYGNQPYLAVIVPIGGKYP